MGFGILVGIIAAAGLLGGTANYYMEQANGAGFRKSVLLGLTAAATVPLFLKTVSSNLMAECLAGDVISHFVFFGFCTIAAIFSSKFLQSLGDKLLQEMKEVKQKQEELTETTDVLVAQSSDPANESATAPPAGDSEGSEFESFQTGANKSAAQVMSDEQKILGVLRSGRFAFRTAEGIATDAHLEATAVQIKLQELEAAGKVKKTRRTRDNVWIWRLS
jgi:hypothetical protein